MYLYTFFFLLIPRTFSFLFFQKIISWKSAKRGAAGLCCIAPPRLA